MPPKKSSRPEGLPEIHEMKSRHPKRPPNVQGRTLYYIQDTSESGMTRALQTEVDVPIIYGTEQAALDYGYFPLQEGDYLFSRPTGGDRGGGDDVLVVAVFDKARLDKKDVAALDDAMRNILGPSPSLDFSSETGTAFERGKPSKVGEARCYTITSSHEMTRGLTAPCADGRSDKKDDDVLDMRQELARVVNKIALTNMNAAPEEIMKFLQMNAELANLPSCGVSGNVAFSSGQINFAPAKRLGYVGSTTSLGQFGEKHCDKGDFAGSYTHITTFMTEGAQDTGRFFLSYPGVYIPTSKYSSFVFSGLRHHGSSPALAPAQTSDAKLKKIARINLVSYLKKRCADSDQRFGLCSIPGGKKGKSVEMFCLPPEFGPEVTTPVAACSHATYARDGHVIMDPKSLTEFIARCTLSFALGM
ncbi:hypothetical protein BDN70DRAFT_902360, partial [Pholiota conissans]